ncbi:MAG: menaquinone biosynthesis decarboxylase, partial [Armatimonadetes bacterium]|nr:menaquinone biosynthesis decarboxylase [Armatimonadota bacterium]
ADRVMKAGGPALLFERPKGYDIPLLINAFGSYRRMSLALGVDDLEEIAIELASLVKLEPPRSLGETLALGGRLLPALMHTRPKRVRDGPCKEVIEKEHPILDFLPIQTCWPEDGGPFITLPLVFTRHPVTGKRNVGMYRMQKYDSSTTGMHWQLHKVGAEHYRTSEERGQRIPVAVALGGDPVLTYAATAPLPPEIDEIAFAGWLRKQPIELVPCETNDLEVPASAEVILEGYVDPQERRMEGPFGDHTGYYSLAEEFPVFHLTCITRRKNPVYPGTIVGRPPMEDKYLGLATERIFLPLIRLFLPEVVDMHLPAEACFHNLVIVSIRKRWPGHAFKVINGMWGIGQLMFSKCIIVVDQDVNVHDPVEVVWRAANNIDAQRDILFTKGPIDQLDHAGQYPNFGAKMGIDATRKWASEGFTRPWPPDIVMTEDVKKQVDAIWDQLGLGPLPDRTPRRARDW